MLSKNPALLIEDSRIDQAAHGGNSIGGDAGSESVLPDSLLVGRKVNAVDLVFRNITEIGKPLVRPVRLEEV